MTEYVLQMKSFTEDPDVEAAHGDADDLLIQIIVKELLPRITDEQQATDLKKVIDTYDNLTKWYA